MSITTEIFLSKLLLNCTKRSIYSKQYFAIATVVTSVYSSQQMSSTNTMQIAILQLPVGPNITENVTRAMKALCELKKSNPKLRLAILPETFNAPYAIDQFAKNSELIPQGYTSQELSKVAETLNIFIIGGSIIERTQSGEYFNTCTIWSPKGELIGRHRKIHLFTMNIEPENMGGVQFDESAVLSPGNKPTIVEIDNHKIGIGICHDKRFAELAQIYRNLGCDMIVYPSAFCICQGPMHWELLQRSRASDNQLYVVTCAPARNNMSGYVAYGHSMIVDPWGRVLREAGEQTEFIVEDIDFDKVTAVRRQIPIHGQRRLDVYDTILKKQ